MNARLALAACSLALAACGPRVTVTHAPAPAVPVDASTFAVVSTERACHPIADALIDSLRDREVAVRPGAPVRLYVTGCETRLRPTIDLTSHVDGTDGTATTSRRVWVQGRGVAALAVVADEAIQAHLLGAARSWAQADPSTAVPALRRAAARDLTQAVADDLAAQLRPVPRLVARRVYPRAPEGSSRALTTRAVEAELLGDYDAARDLALRAWRADPSPRALSYLRELDTLLLLRRPPSP